MPREFPRTRRVGEQLQRELAGLVRDEIKDPRLGMISISGATVSRDLAYATVYVSVLGDDKEGLYIDPAAAAAIAEKLVEAADVIQLALLGDDKAVTESVAVLNRAAGFLRHRLGQSMRIRTVPQLKFDFDSSLRDGARMDALINAAVSGNRPEEDETE